LATRQPWRQITSFKADTPPRPRPPHRPRACPRSAPVGGDNEVAAIDDVGTDQQRRPAGQHQRAAFRGVEHL
jgi:hypothetical protein